MTVKGFRVERKIKIGFLGGELNDHKHHSSTLLWKKVY